MIGLFTNHLNNHRIRRRNNNYFKLKLISKAHEKNTINTNTTHDLHRL